jgi:nitroreductase
MEVLEAIKTRRSVRKYKPDPVDGATLEKVLEAAHWAPSWANTQCWRFVVVQDRELKGKVAATLTPKNGAIPAIESAPLVIVACARLGKAGFASDGTARSDKGDWYMFDVGLALQNLLLAAHALGLATVPVGAFDANEVAGLLGVPDGFCVVALTPLGYPAEEPAPRPRKNLADIFFHNRFGEAAG